MAYGRSYRYKRRTMRYRRRGRLSQRNIFGNRGARSQAGQISALNRKINKVYKRCKPEFKMAYDQPGDITILSKDEGDDRYLGLGDCNITRDADDDSRTGDKIRAKTTYYFNIEYFNSAPSGYVAGMVNGTSVRVILGRTKVPIGTGTYPTPQNLLTGWSDLNLPNMLGSIIPLRCGITEDYIIDRDFTIHLTQDSNNRTFKVKSPWFTRRFNDAGSSASDNPSNHVFCLVLPAGLQVKENYYEKLRVAWCRKTVFTDA